MTTQPTPVTKEEEAELNRLELIARNGDCTASLEMFRILQKGSPNEAEYLSSMAAMPPAAQTEFLMRMVMDLTARLQGIEAIFRNAVRIPLGDTPPVN